VDATFDGTTGNPALREELSAALRQARSSGNRDLEAAVRARLGRLFLTEPATGEAHARLALEISRASGNRETEAAALFALGEAKMNRRLPRRALEPLAAAAEIYHRLGDRRGESASLDLLSRAQERFGLYEEALAHLEKARAVRSKGSPIVREATERMRLGRLCYALGRYREAAQHLQAPLQDLGALRERVGSRAYDRFLEALLPLIEKFRKGRGEEVPREDAADMVEGSVEGFFQLATFYGVPSPTIDLPKLRREEEEWLDGVLSDRAVTAQQIVDRLAARNADLFAQGRIPKALKAWFAEQADRLNERLRNLRSGGDLTTSENIETASSDAIKERIGRTSFEKAIGLQYLLGALLAADTVREMRMGPKPSAELDDPDLARVQQTVWAEMVREEAERPVAPPGLSTTAEFLEELTRRMLPWFQAESAKTLGPEDAEAVAALACEAELHNFLGRILALDGSPKEAAEQHRKAWDIVEATDLRALQLWIPRSHESTARSVGYDLVSEHGGARALGLPPAPSLSKPCGNEIDGSLDLWWGDFLAAARRDGEALQRYERAAARGIDQVRPLALGGIAAVHQRQGNRQEALAVYRKAIDAAESILGQIRLDQLVSSFAGRQAPLYARAIDLATELAQPDLAFELAERARARAFLNQIGNRRIDFRGVPPELIVEWERAREKLADVRARRRADPHDAGDAEAEDLARQAYEEILGRLRQASPEYSSLVAVEVAGLEEVRQLLPSETTLVAYFVLDRRTLAWVIDKDEDHLIELPISADDLRDQVETFRLQVEHRGDDDLEAQALYAALLEPLKPFLRNPHLVLVPHGPLHYLPFAALRDPTGRHLIEDYSLSLMPNASALRFARRGEAAAGALVLGDPDGSLPQAGREAESVASVYGVQAYHGIAATEALVRTQAGRSGILHLAAHGAYDPVHPLFSRIELAAGQGEDGRLEVHEIYQLDLSATRLVVLSACDTALGERSEGDDIVGLTRALLATGAPSAITTLWKIDDQSTEVLMTSLHRRLRQGGSVAEAIRGAQLEILTRPEWRSPFFWAAFTLTGVEGIPPTKPEPRVSQTSPAPPPPAPSADPESDLVAALFRIKDRAREDCRPVTPNMARILSRFFPPDLVSAVCWITDSQSGLLQDLSFHEDLPVLPLEDVLVFRTLKDSEDAALWTHALMDIFLQQRVGISGFVRVYLKSQESAEGLSRDMAQFVAGRLATRLEADPRHRCADNELQLWKGIDFDSHCKSLGHQGAVLIQPNAHGWKCLSQDGERLSINVAEACRWQYCGTSDRPFFGDFNSAYSWFCASDH
jgi:CHAT domain-containing protein